MKEHATAILLTISAVFVVLFIAELFENKKLRENNFKCYRDSLSLKYPKLQKLKKPWYIYCVKDNSIVMFKQPKREFNIKFGNNRNSALVVDQCTVSRTKPKNMVMEDK